MRDRRSRRSNTRSSGQLTRRGAAEKLWLQSVVFELGEIPTYGLREAAIIHYEETSGQEYNPVGATESFNNKLEIVYLRDHSDYARKLDKAIRKCRQTSARRVTTLLWARFANEYMYPQYPHLKGT